VSIVTSLLHANYKENLMTRFSTKSTKVILKARLYLFMLPWQRHIRQLNYQKTKVCVVNLVAANFGHRGIKGFREKGVTFFKSNSKLVKWPRL